MKVLLLCGTYPPAECGIGDYTLKLATELQNQKIEISIIANINWSFKYFYQIYKKIKDVKPDVLHIQYPSEGYKMSLVPQLLSLKFKSVVTLHEVSQVHWLRKLALLPFSFAHKIIFTNPFEETSFKRLFPWRKENTSVIPIGSNINENSQIDTNKYSLFNIVHFGQIRPNKGIEEVIKLSKLVKVNNLPYKVTIIGQVLYRFRSYYELLKNDSVGLDIAWLINSSEDDVSKSLHSSLISYLPFPDGASYRRGSLFAALTNKMLVFTTLGTQTTDDILKAVNIVQSAEELINVLKEFDTNELTVMFENKKDSIKELLRNISWPQIAFKHINIYQTVITSK